MSELYYTTQNGERSGRASHFYRNQSSADTVKDKQNSKAESEGLRVRYSTESCDDAGIDAKEIRD